MTYYYKLPRISRTPSPPREYLRLRQKMGGASLPALPEDGHDYTEQSSRLEQPHHIDSDNETPTGNDHTFGYETDRAERPKKRAKRARLTQNKRYRPTSVDSSRVLSDVETDNMHESIVVKGATLTVGKGINKVGEETAGTGASGDCPRGLGIPMGTFYSDPRLERPKKVQVGPETNSAGSRPPRGRRLHPTSPPITNASVQLPSAFNKGTVPMADPPPKKRKTVKYVKPYHPKAPSRPRPDNITGDIESNGPPLPPTLLPVSSHPGPPSITAPLPPPPPAIIPPPQPPITAIASQSTTSPPVAERPRIAAPTVISISSSPEPELETIASKAVVAPTVIPLAASVSQPAAAPTAPSALPVTPPASSFRQSSETSDLTPLASDTPSPPDGYFSHRLDLGPINYDSTSETEIRRLGRQRDEGDHVDPVTSKQNHHSLRRSARTPVQSNKVREVEGFPSPNHITFRISRAGPNRSRSSSPRPLKLTGRDLVRNGRWKWERITDRIEDHFEFNRSLGDELLINYKHPIHNPDEIKKLEAIFKDQGDNDIMVIRTDGQGNYPAWVYQKMRGKNCSPEPKTNSKLAKRNAQLHDAPDSDSDRTIEAPLEGDSDEEGLAKAKNARPKVRNSSFKRTRSQRSGSRPQLNLSTGTVGSQAAQPIYINSDTPEPILATPTLLEIHNSGQGILLDQTPPVSGTSDMPSQAPVSTLPLEDPVPPVHLVHSPQSLLSAKPQTLPPSDIPVPHRSKTPEIGSTDDPEPAVSHQNIIPETMMKGFHVTPQPLHRNADVTAVHIADNVANSAPSPQTLDHTPHAQSKQTTPPPISNTPNTDVINRILRISRTVPRIPFFPRQPIRPSRVSSTNLTSFPNPSPENTSIPRFVPSMSTPTITPTPMVPHARMEMPTQKSPDYALQQLPGISYELAHEEFPESPATAVAAEFPESPAAAVAAKKQIRNVDRELELEFDQGNWRSGRRKIAIRNFRKSGTKSITKSRKVDTPTRKGHAPSDTPTNGLTSEADENVHDVYEEKSTNKSTNGLGQNGEGMDVGKDMISMSSAKTQIPSASTEISSLCNTPVATTSSAMVTSTSPPNWAATASISATSETDTSETESFTSYPAVNNLNTPLAYKLYTNPKSRHSTESSSAVKGEPQASTALTSTPTQAPQFRQKSYHVAKFTSVNSAAYLNSSTVSGGHILRNPSESLSTPVPTVASPLNTAPMTFDAHTARKSKSGPIAHLSANSPPLPPLPDLSSSVSRFSPHSPQVGKNNQPDKIELLPPLPPPQQRIHMQPQPAQFPKASSKSTQHARNSDERPQQQLLRQRRPPSPMKIPWRSASMTNPTPKKEGFLEWDDDDDDEVDEDDLLLNRRRRRFGVGVGGNEESGGGSGSGGRLFRSARKGTAGGGGRGFDIEAGMDDDALELGF